MITTYHSNIKTISSSGPAVYKMLSDLNNLEIVGHTSTMAGKFQILSYDENTCLLDIEKLGRVGIAIVERKEHKYIRFQSKHLPICAEGEIFIDEVLENQTQLQLVLAADLTWTLKMMLNRQIEKGVNQLADFFEEFLNTSLDQTV